MAEIDITQEWRRLQELYAGMSEEELEKVAGEGYALTDIAKQVLHSEILRRGLQVQVRLEPPNENEAEEREDHEFDPFTLDLTAAYVVESREQAEWVKKTLNDAGVPCYFGRDLLERVETLKFVPDHPIQVKVLKNDASRVRWLLRDFSERFPSPEDNEPLDLEVHCPACRSTEVMLEALGSTVPGEVANDDEETQDNEEPQEVQEADPHQKLRWKCDACGHEWEDEGLES